MIDINKQIANAEIIKFGEPPEKDACIKHLS